MIAQYLVKIALVHKRLDLNGGTERDLFKTAEGLRDLGHEVHLFCSEYKVDVPKKIVAHSIPVIPLGRTLRLWSFAWRAPAVIARANCDIVISFGRLLRQDILRSGGGTHRRFLKGLAQQGGIRRRIWQRLSVYHRSLLALEKRQFAPANSRLIIAVSEQVKQDIVCNYAVPPERIIVLYNGVDTERFHPDTSRQIREQVRNRWKIPSDAPLVLFVGSGFRRKGLDALLSLWESPRIKPLYLLVVGADARLSRYRARANAIAPGRVVFTGRQDDIENYYAAADVVALLSIQEAFGNVLLEALASGLPVLVTRNVGACEIVQGPFREGVIDVTDPREVQADKLLALLKSSHQPEIRRKARSLAEAYSWGKHFARLERLLTEARPISRGGSDSVPN